MELACPIVLLLLQCRSILCLHPVNVLSLWCFYRESLLLLQFLLVGRTLVGFVPSSLCEWNRRTDKMKRSFFLSVVSILLYGCTTWTLTKRLEKKLDGNYTRMLRAILNKSWRQHPTRHQLYGHLPPITKTIQVRRTRHAGHCWRSKDELISDVLLWTPTYGQAKGRTTSSNLHTAAM